MASGRRPEDIRRFMDAATTSAHRAAALTHRLLAFARRQSLDTRPNDINRLIAGMEDLLHRTLGEQVESHSNLAAELWTAFVDANQLENAILNLAINARDAMMDGGKLTIATANTRLNETYTSQHEDLRRATMSLSAFRTRALARLRTCWPRRSIRSSPLNLPEWEPALDCR
jgi:signal transduction histidine kinase